jgi:Uma2 family endonuclease
MTAILGTSDYEIERKKPMPSKNHAFIQGRLIIALALKYQNQFTLLPEINLDLPAGVRVPDLAIYPPMHFEPQEDEIRLSEMPLAVVEIISPTQELTELIAKSNDYFRAGVKSYWLVLPPLRTIYIFHGANDYEIFSRHDVAVDKQLEIALDLKEIFQ